MNSAQRMMIGGALLASVGVSINRAAAMEKAIAVGRQVGLPEDEIERIRLAAIDEAQRNPHVRDAAALVRARLLQAAWADEEQR